ncbi:MAG: ferredoxin-type protein NapF [Methylobacter sp.]
MPSAISRRALLTGQLKATSPPLRPPWAIPEAQFIDACTACSRCIKDCEEGILKKGSGGFPEVDFSLGECTFCQRCVDACPDQALQKTATPWQLKAHINDNCLTHQHIVCLSCGENCDAQAIRFSQIGHPVAQPKIDANLCTGCGACFNPCPTQAISLCQNSI